jgi:hypothetical protein
MLRRAPPLHVSAMEVGTIILLEIYAEHESLRGHRVISWQSSISVAFGLKQTFSEPRLQSRIYEYAP